MQKTLSACQARVASERSGLSFSNLHRGALWASKALRGRSQSCLQERELGGAWAHPRASPWPAAGCRWIPELVQAEEPQTCCLERRLGKEGLVVAAPRGKTNAFLVVFPNSHKKKVWFWIFVAGYSIKKCKLSHGLSSACLHSRAEGHALFFCGFSSNLK